MLLSTNVCAVCCKFAKRKVIREQFSKFLGKSSTRQQQAEFSDAVIASGVFNDSCHVQYVCSTCEKKLKKGASLESIRPKDLSYPNCENGECSAGNCEFDSILEIFKNKKTKNSLFWFEESELVTIREIMASLQVHSFGPSKSEHGTFRQLNLFRTRTNITVCEECWYLCLKRPSTKNWQPPTHQCSPNEQTQMTAVLEELSIPASTSSIASSSCNELNDALLNFSCLSDDSQLHNGQRKSVESVLSRKRLSEDFVSPSKRQRSSNVCGNSFAYSDDNVEFEISCRQIIDENDATHKHKACNYRYGNKADWSTNTNSRKRFLNELLTVVLSPTFRHEFMGMLNQKLENLIKPEEDNNIVVDQNQTVAKVKVISSTNLPRPIFIATRYSHVVNLTEEKVRNLAGNYCSRRELQRSVQMLRSTGLRPPKNIALNMARERKKLHDQIEVNDYDETTFLVKWSSNGLLDFLNR